MRGFFYGFFILAGPGILGLAFGFFNPGEVSIEFANVGGWLTFGDPALDSCAHFLAVAEHRLIPSRARSICHQLRTAGFHSVWAPACQDRIAGGHAGVGIVSLGRAPLSLPSFVTPQFHEFFKLVRAMRTTLPRRELRVHVWIFLLAVLLLLRLVLLLIGGSLAFVLVPGWLMLLAPLPVSLFGLLVGLILLMGPLRRPLVWFRMSGIFTGRSLGVVPEDVILALRDAVSRSSVDDFWSIWSGGAEAGLFRAYALAGGPTAAGSSAFLGRGLLRIRSRRLGGRAAGGTSSSRLYRVSHGDDVDKLCAQYFVNSSLAPVLLFRRRLKSVADVLKGIRNNGFTQSRCSALLVYWGAVCRHGPCGPLSPLHPWDSGIPPDFHGFYK